MQYLHITRDTRGDNGYEVIISDSENLDDQHAIEDSWYYETRKEAMAAAKDMQARQHQKYGLTIVKH